MRLAGGSSPSNGRVEVCFGGQWGSVCSYYRVWDSLNAAVVCNQLGFPKNSEYATTAYLFCVQSTFERVPVIMFACLFS